MAVPHFDGVPGALVIVGVVGDRRRQPQIVDVLYQPAAAGHVDELEPQADGQDRDAGLVGAAEQFELERLAPRVHRLGLRVSRFAVALRVEIRAAGEEQAIDALQDFFDQRGAAGAGGTGSGQARPPAASTASL